MPLNQNLTTTERKGLHLTPGFSILALILLASTVWAQERPSMPGASKRDRNENWVGTWSTALHEPDLGVFPERRAQRPLGLPAPRLVPRARQHGGAAGA